MQQYIISFLFLYCQIVFGVQSFTLILPINNSKRYNLLKNDDIDVDGGGSRSSYSWVNPKLNEDTSKEVHSNIIRIHFDGCGQILLHQEPQAFIQPIHNKKREEAGRTCRCGQILLHKEPNDFVQPIHNKTEEGSSGRTGVTLWAAAYVVSNYIDAQFSEGGIWSSSNWTVLELGSGLGLCSAVAAKHGMDIVSTDNDLVVLQLLKENLERNKHSDEQQIHVHSLDWTAAASDSNADKTHPVFLELESLGGADLILLSDVIYGATESVVSRLTTVCLALFSVSFLIFSSWFDLSVGISIGIAQQVLCTKAKALQRQCTNKLSVR